MSGLIKRLIKNVCYSNLISIFLLEKTLPRLQHIICFDILWEVIAIVIPNWIRVTVIEKTIARCQCPLDLLFSMCL